MGKLFIRFLNDQSGITGIEYGLIALLISTVLVAAAGSAGVQERPLFHQLALSLGPNALLAH